MLRRRVVAAIGVMTIAVSLLPLPVAAAPGESVIPADNPDLQKACGLDVLMVLDESGSIATSNATDDVRNAFRAFVASLKNTGSRMSVVEFSTVARLPSIAGTTAGTYVTIDDSTEPSFNSYINGFNPSGYTNWEDALRVGRFFAPRPDPNLPHLVVFLTDGDPTAVIDNSRVTHDPGNPILAQNEYELKVPLSENETTRVNENAGVTPAIPNANALKAAGSHILALGVGAALQNQSSVDRLIKISGPDVFDGTGVFDIATDDVFLEDDFEELEEALRDAAFQLCAPSVSVRKLYDETPDPDSLDDAVPGVGWVLTGTVTAPPPGTFEWVLPRGATGPTADATTDGAGFATFQWTPTNPDGNSTIEVLEDPANNPPDPPGEPYQNVPELTECTIRTPDTDDEPLDIDVDPIGGFSAVLPPESIVTCVIVNTAVPAPSVTIEKYTNGFDADLPTGPIIPLGGPVSWTYDVTNTGNTTLSSIAVTDVVTQPTPGAGPTVSCPSTTLAPGETFQCTASGTAGAGQYANTAEVTAVDSHGTGVSAVDPSHYFGEDSSIQVVKFTQGDDANQPPGPLIAVGGTVNWTYQVTNTGNAPLANVALTDDNGTPDDTSDDFVPTFGVGDTNGDILLDPGETWEYSATGVAVAGLYENVATVTGDPPVGTQVRDNDPSHYFGVLSGITIEKATNGEDADTPTGPAIRVGSPVQWTYVVTNTGNMPIASYIVEDDVLGAVACPRPVLGPGRSVTCHATGTAEEGQYANVGTVDATDILGSPLTDSDPSHYIGIRPELTIEKATNGDDADDPTGPFVPVGGPVTWDYLVTNTGDGTITDLVVLDFRIGGASIVGGCTPTTLAPGATATCQTTGVAIVGQYHNLAVAIGRDQFGELVADVDPSHYFGAESGITLKKYTNGVDADEAPGVLIPAGGVVEWSYVVLNSGNSTLDSIELVDDQIGPITCPQDTLAPGVDMTCTATGTAVRGQYANTATVTAVDQAATPVSDDDPSHYFGYLIDVDIEKSTNGEDADDPTGPVVPIGDPVTWTYVVTNPGDFAIKEVVVTDDQGLTPVFEGGDANSDQLLDPDETWTYSATGTAEPGQYANVATANGLGTDEGETPVTDSDPSHYIGVDVGTASVGDTVWRDNNRNGVQDSGEPGIPGARVTIDSTTPTVQATAVPVTVTTDADGQYLVTELLAGEYVISIDMASVDGTLTTPGSVTVTLAVGQNFLDGDFGLAQVVPPPDPEDPDDEIDALPLTGADLDREAMLGLLLILLGGAFLLTSNREDPTETAPRN